MVKPLWALAGVALLGVTGVAGAVIVASSGGEEEVVRQVETATPTGGSGAKDPRTTATGTPSAATETPAACDPNPSPAPGNMLFRWGDITLQLPADRRLRTLGSVADEHQGPTLRVFHEASASGDTYIDATTGAILPESYVDPQTGTSVPRERVPHSEVEPALATISVCPFDQSRAPWPYNGDPPASPPKTHGKLRYLEPDPASGIQVLTGLSCSEYVEGGQGGCSDFLEISNARSRTRLDVETGAIVETSVAESDRDAVERYLDSVQIDEAQ